MTDLIDQDLGDRDIEINNDPPAVNNQNVGSDNRKSNASSSSSKEYEKKNSDIISRDGSLDQALARNITQKAKDQVYKSWIDRYLCCFNWLKKYFQITTKDFFNRILWSIIPFNSKFYDAIEKSPDFYGPFWIYTSFIVLVSSCGSLTRTIQGHREQNFFQEFIPTAAILMYFVGFGVPLLISVLTKIFGAKISVAPVICIYGYSYTIFLPIIIVCSIPNNLLQWILLAYGIVSSTSLIIMNLSKGLASMDKGKKIVIIIIILIFQVIIFVMLKLYFFKHLNKELMTDNATETPATTNPEVK
jgi:hypothetical protein